jgi:hypothetical protein
MLINKFSSNISIKLFLTISLFIIPASCFAMLCPNNFNTVDIGYSMDKVIELCGEPDSKSDYKETITLSDSGSYNQTSGTYYQSQNYYQALGNNNSQKLNDVKQKVIIVTKFIYSGAQPAILTFYDDVLQNRELVPR